MKSTILLLGAFFGTPVLAALPTLHCTINDGGETIAAEFKPSSNSYEAKAVQSPHFRIKAVILENDGQSLLAKIYTYYKSGQEYSLLHLAKYVIPLEAGKPQFPSLGPVNYIYSPNLGHELSYACRFNLSE